MFRRFSLMFGSYGCNDRGSFGSRRPAEVAVFRALTASRFDERLKFVLLPSFFATRSVFFAPSARRFEKTAFFIFSFFDAGTSEETSDETVSFVAVSKTTECSDVISSEGTPKSPNGKEPNNETRRKNFFVLMTI